jgi:hypothetical protein
MREISERRNSPRFPWAADVRIAVVSLLDVPEEDQLSVQGVAENVGHGGVGILSDWLLPLNAVVRCEFPISDSPAFVPTLLTVRWSSKVDGKKQYKFGLQFLL